MVSRGWRGLISLPVTGVVPSRYPNTACELLTCDVPQINDRLGGDEALLDLLYDFLGREPPLNPLLASFFSKTIGNLIARKTEQVQSLPGPCGLRAGLAVPTELTVSRHGAATSAGCGDSVPSRVVGLSGAVRTADM